MNEEGGVTADYAGVGVAVQFRPLFQEACPGSQGPKYAGGLDDRKGLEGRRCPPSLRVSFATLKSFVGPVRCSGVGGGICRTIVDGVIVFRLCLGGY